MNRNPWDDIRKPADVNNGLNHGMSRVITMVTNYGYY